MTAEANKIPVSVDYTGRDYYALRNELIAVVKDRTNQKWAGNDPNDFGLALVEAFAYMGDLVNYYVDRAANESYLATATQRQTLIELAAMYGYTPSGYNSAMVDITFTSKLGNRSSIGPAIMTAGTATVALEATHTFEVGDLVAIRNVPRNEFNGIFEVTAVGIQDPDGSGNLYNTISYRPTGTISSISGNGTTVTVVSDNYYFVDQEVVISGVTPSAYNGTYTVTAIGETPAGLPTFSFAGTTTTTYVSGGSVVFSSIPVNETWAGNAFEIGYDTIPAGTQVQTEVKYNEGTENVIFTTNAAVTVPYWGAATVSALHGEDISYRSENLANEAISGDIAGELIGESTGSVEQSFVLKETRVDADSIAVFVESASTYEEWTKVTHLLDFGPTAAVYTVTIDADNYISINFGDGISGAIPPRYSKIKATYIYGGGPIGNIPKYSFNASASTIRMVPNVTEVAAARIIGGFTLGNNEAGSGGTDPESNEAIRNNAPATLRALNRAVSLSDFASLALSFGDVAKANAIAELANSVTLYIAPTSNDSVGDPTPGIVFGAPSVSWTYLKNQLASFMADKIQIGTTLTIVEPRYTNVVMEVEYTKLPKFTTSIVETRLKEVITTSFEYNSLDFADVITPEEIEFKLRQVDGISNVRVTQLYREGGSGRTSLIGDPDEIFSFSESKITLTAAESEASLVNMLITPGVWDKPFAADVYSYRIVVPAGTTAVDVTAFRNSSAESITINDATVANGAVSSIPIEPGNTRIRVVITAANGVTTKSYVFNVSLTSSSNSNMASLVPSVGALAPTFSPSVNSYIMSLANSVSSIKFTATSQDALAEIKLNTTLITSGTETGALALSVGSNIFSFVVTADDGITLTNYVVNVFRAEP